MMESGTDALGVLRWGLRRYRLLFLACLVLGAVVAPIAASNVVRPADAEALVVNTRLDTDLTALPRYGEAVFNNGQVAQAVAASFGDGGDFDDVIPDRVSLVADQDSRLFGRQSGNRAGHEQLAADLAGEQADPGIAHAVGEEAAQLAPQRAGKDVDQLVVGGVVLPIAGSVRRAELRQHVGDDRGLGILVRRGLRKRAVALAQGLPVLTAELRVIEMPVHQPPYFDEPGVVRLLVRRHLRAGRRGESDDQKNDEGNVSPDHECSRHAMRQVII